LSGKNFKGVWKVNFNAMHQMARQGKAVVFIRHKLGEVIEIADDIANLRRGQIVDERRTKAFSTRSDLVRRMVGRDVLLEIDRPVVEPRQPVSQVEGLGGAVLQGINFQLRQGALTAACPGGRLPGILDGRIRDPARRFPAGGAAAFRGKTSNAGAGA
jgi:hypothetical protein